MTEESTNREGKKPRRGKGEGSITQRKDGTWQGVLDLGFIAGKRQRRYVYARTRSEAGRKLRALREQLKQGAATKEEKAAQTVAEYMNDWYDACIDGNGASATQKMCWEQIEHHIIPGLGEFTLAELDYDTIQKWVKVLRTTRRRPTYTPKDEHGQLDEKKAAELAAAQPFLSPRRVQIIFKVLDRALNHAVQRGIIPNNPANAVVIPPVPAYTPCVPLDEDVEQVLQGVVGHRLEALYHLLICLGLRRGEPLELEWRDLHLEKGNASLYVREGKTISSERTIPLSDELVDSLLRHRERQQQEQAAFGPDWNPRKLVFPSEAGTPILGTNLYRQFKDILCKVGVETKRSSAGTAHSTKKHKPSIRPHDLRHWAASYLLREGVPLKEVQEILGHKSPTTTLKIYAHVIGNGKREAINRISQLLKYGE